MKRAGLFGAVVIAVTALGGGSVLAGSYQVCKSTYALCTTAKCTSAEPGSDTVECKCEVRTGYSVGSSPCQEPTKTKAGEQIRSRYYPIKSYARCVNNRPWATCYDKECIVDKDDPTKATCTCSVKEDEGDWVMVTNTYSAETCTIGLYSSATVTELEKVTDFLKGQKNLKPFPLQVLNAHTLGEMTPSSAK